MEIKKIGIILLCILVVLIISFYKSIEQKKVENILNEDIQLDNINVENFKVYDSNMCDKSLNSQCPYPQSPIYDNYF